MKSKLLASLTIFLGATALCLGQGTNRIVMVFSNAEISTALKAISVRTGASIVYSAGKDDSPVTLNVSVDTTEQAVQSVAAAGGVIYRKVGPIYVVASASKMKQVLETYDTTQTFEANPDFIQSIADKIQTAFPYSTVTAMGSKITMKGLPLDLRAAGDLIAEIEQLLVASRPVSAVVVLKNISAATIAPLIQSMFPDLKVAVTVAAPTTDLTNPSPGAIAVSGTAAEVSMAQEAIAKLDEGEVGNATVMQAYHLKYLSANSITDLMKQMKYGVDVVAGPEAFLPKRAYFSPLTSSIEANLNGGSSTGTTGGSTGGSTSGGTGDQFPGPQPSSKPGDRSETVILKGRENDVKTVVALLEKLDVKPKQLLVEVNVIETSPETDESSGISYNWAPFDFIESAPGSLLQNNPAGTAFTQNVSTKSAGLGQISRVPWNFRAVLSAMITHKTAKILASPTVGVEDNSQAFVFIGNTIRARVVSAGALGTENVQIQEFPVGIILLISPRVNSDGNITLHVNPVVSTVTSVDSNNIPQTSSREAETTTIVKDGETVVLGGLIQDVDQKTVQEIPFLSKLPIIGELFKYRTSNHSRTDILVSITPHLLDDDGHVVTKKQP